MSFNLPERGTPGISRSASEEVPVPGELTPPRPPLPASSDATGTQICGGRITERLSC